MSNIPESFKVVEPEWGSALGAWWAFTWRNILFLILFIIVASIFFGILGAVLGAVGGEVLVGIFSMIGGIVGFFGAFVVQVYVFKRLMEKGFGGKKRLMIVEDEEVTV